MPSIWERLLARVGWIHASRVHRQFLRATEAVDATQTRTLARVMRVVAPSEMGRSLRLDRVKTLADLRAAAPLTTYEDWRPRIERVMDGDVGALFAPQTRIHMFATSSGTTAKQKYIPVTAEFARQYQRGWNAFGVKLLTDHPAAILRAILQSSGRYDESHTRSDVPIGAITGLMARFQKRIVRRFYVGNPDLALIPDPIAKYYALMRFAIVRDVAFAITANPASLIQLAHIANQHAESLIRDVRDGAISAEWIPDATLRARLAARLRPDPGRARVLEQIRGANGVLRPRDYWSPVFLACWIGGSLCHYRERLAQWWGELPVRDIGLLASEGRVSIPFVDNEPVGVLDVHAATFEFIPADQWDADNPDVLGPRELESGCDYAVILTNDAGLLRYRLNDVVRMRGWLGHAPLLEFRHRAGRVASVAGEKLTENQVVAAVRDACAHLSIASFDFIIGPVWGDPPFYRVTAPVEPGEALAAAIDGALAEQNDEYRSRRDSGRLGRLQVRQIDDDCLTQMDIRLKAARKSTAEQYKRPYLLLDFSEDDHVLFGAAPGA